MIRLNLAVARTVPSGSTAMRWASLEHIAELVGLGDAAAALAWCNRAEVYRKNAWIGRTQVTLWCTRTAIDRSRHYAHELLRAIEPQRDRLRRERVAAILGPLAPRKLDHISPDDEWVYFIQSGDDGAVKIGSARDVAARRGELQTGSPVRLHVRAVVRGGSALEKWLHRRFARHHVRGEWYGLNPRLHGLIDRINHARRHGCPS